jgi:hypothetical protein
MQKKLNLFHGAAALRGPGPYHYQSFAITDTPHLVGFLWTSDQHEAKASARIPTHCIAQSPEWAEFICIIGVERKG